MSLTLDPAARPQIDRESFEILHHGAFETATFALG